MKLNFFSRVYLAITDFRLYPYVVQKEKFSIAFAYFLCFIILVSIILSTNATVKVVNWLYEFKEVYQEEVSDYTVRDGKLNMEENMDLDFLGAKIYTDDSTLIKDVDFNKVDIERYKFVVMAFKDELAVGNSKYGYITLNYKDFNLNTSKQLLYKMIDLSLKSNVFKISLVGIIFCIVFASYFLTRFFHVILITLMLLFLGMVFRTNYNFKEYMKVAFYVITLPTITEIIALLFIGELNEYANITYYLLSYVYMFYAIRALKLDNIIIATQEKIMSMKNESEKANDILNTEKEKNAEEEKNTEEKKDMEQEKEKEAHKEDEENH